LVLATSELQLDRELVLWPGLCEVHEMFNEKKLVGTTTGTGKVQGHTCKYRRTLKLTHVGN